MVCLRETATVTVPYRQAGFWVWWSSGGNHSGPLQPMKLVERNRREDVGLNKADVTGLTGVCQRPLGVERHRRQRRPCRRNYIAIQPPD